MFKGKASALRSDFLSPSSERDVSRVVLVEPINTLKERLILSDALSRLAPRSTCQKRLLECLFASPITTRTFSSNFENSVQLRKAIMAVNKSYVGEYPPSEYGNAVLRVPLWQGKEKITTGFWVLMLNPRIFVVPEKAKIEPRKDIRFADIANLTLRRLWHHVAQKLFVALRDLRDVERQNAAKLVTRYTSDNLEPRIELKLPSLLTRTTSLPKIYRANPEFAKSYGVEIPETTKKAELDQLFLENDIELLCRIAEYKAVTLKDVAQGVYVQNIKRQINRINKRCSELSLPDAIIQDATVERRKCYYMNPSFAKLFEFCKGKRVSITAVFTVKQVYILRALAEHPLCSNDELANAAGMSTRGLSEILNRIDRVCEKNNLPKIIRQKTTRGEIYYLPPKLACLLSLRQGAVKREKLFAHSAIQKRVFRRLVCHHNETPEEVSKRIGEHLGDTIRTFAIINKRLARFGFGSI